MIDKYLNQREIIRQYTCNQEYEKSIKECYVLLEMITTERNITEDTWFCYYMLSYNFYLLGENDIAIENAKYAALKIKNINTTNYIRTIWQLANCYRETRDIKGAINMFKICSSYYRTIRSYKLRLNCMFNIATLLKYPFIMERILNLYSSKVKVTDETVYNQSEYEKSVINQMYIETVDMYIAQGQRSRAFMLINTIKDKNLKTQLSKKLLAA